MLSVAVLIHNRRLVPTAECNVTYARKLLIVLNDPISVCRWTYAYCFGGGQNPGVRGCGAALRLPGSPISNFAAHALNNLSGTQYGGETKAQTKQETDRGSDGGTLDENHKRI